MNDAWGFADGAPVIGERSSTGKSGLAHLGPVCTAGDTSLGQAVLIAVRGDNMSPQLRDGCPVLVQAAARPETHGAGLYAFSVGTGGGKVYRVSRLANCPGWRLTSDNQRYEDQVVSDADFSCLPCVGRVIMVPAW